MAGGSEFDVRIGEARLQQASDDPKIRALGNETMRVMRVSIENDKPFYPLVETVHTVFEDSTVAAVSDAWIHDEASDEEMRQALDN